MSIRSFGAGKLDPVFARNTKPQVSPEEISKRIRQEIVKAVNETAMNFDFLNEPLENIVVVSEGPQRKGLLFELATARVHTNPPVKLRAA